jgi:hypothetical protein
MNSCEFKEIIVFNNFEVGNGLLGLHQYVYKNKPLFFILGFQQIMNSCEFKEIIVFTYFEIENGVLGLERDVYLSIVRFLDSSILRKV